MKKLNELNILCTGQLTSDRSTFLEFYTDSQPSDQKYKVFIHKQNREEDSLIMINQKNGDNNKSLIVYLHEIEELGRIDVYLKYSFDAILFFVKIDAFHNTSKNILDTIQLYSQINGTNVYKVPFRIVVLSNNGENHYDDIGYGDKQRIWLEVQNILNEDQIIFVEYDKSYKCKLSKFYKDIMIQQTLGIKESTYSNWYFRGFSTFFAIDQLKLTIFKLYGQLQLIYQRTMISRILKGDGN